jgi:hypothetical protein
MKRASLFSAEYPVVFGMGRESQKWRFLGHRFSDNTWLSEIHIVD